MITTSILENEINLNETDLQMQLCFENFVLEQVLLNQNEQLLQESAPTQMIPMKKLKYMFTKWRGLERNIEEIKKDIKKCDEAYEKLQKYKEKHKDRGLGKMTLAYLIEILKSFFPITWFDSVSYKHMFGISLGSGVTDADFKGKNKPKKSEMKNDLDIIGIDILYADREIKHCKEYLEKELAKKEKELNSKK